MAPYFTERCTGSRAMALSRRSCRSQRVHSRFAPQRPFSFRIPIAAATCLWWSEEAKVFCAAKVASVLQGVVVGSHKNHWTRCERPVQQVARQGHATPGRRFAARAACPAAPTLGVMNKVIPFAEISIANWADFARIADRFTGHFCFRGQSNLAWGLSTSLERGVSGYLAQELLFEKHEKSALLEFTRRHHLYASDPGPDLSNRFEWLAMLQHYGCPTRLLDFSHSPYVAAHFAVRENSGPYANSSGPFAVWAVNRLRLCKTAHTAFPQLHGTDYLSRVEGNAARIQLANTMIANTNQEPGKQHVLPLEIERLTHRAARQQGLLLFPTRLSNANGKESSFMQNLVAGLESTGSTTEQWISVEPKEIDDEEFPTSYFHCIRFCMQRTTLLDAARQLKAMGIDDEALFPGLEGLAQSLRGVRLA